MDVAKILIDGKWRAADAEGTFHAENPAKGEALPIAFPISRWSDCDLALTAATKAAAELRSIEPAKIAAFLEAYAANIEAAADAIVAAAAEETALPVTPRLKDVELPRTTNQLRQAAAAVREESWRHATLDLEKNIRSCFAPIGPVVIFGPNNFPFAFNGVSGGDFAAAIAAGNPVIAKAHPLHPNTTRLLAEQALKAVEATGLPPATVQLIYNVSNENGLKLVSDPRVGAVGFTGSRNAGLHLKRPPRTQASPSTSRCPASIPSSSSPARSPNAPSNSRSEFVDSVLAGSGQFCTSPNLILVFETPPDRSLPRSRSQNPSANAPRNLFSPPPAASSFIRESPRSPCRRSDSSPAATTPPATAIATPTPFSAPPPPSSSPHRTTCSARSSATPPSPSSSARSMNSSPSFDLLEGNLTGTIYSAKSGADDATYNAIAPLLREKVGRLLNDKMPTGVAVSPAMNHGGPYPSTSHPGSTSVGIPASIARFAKLECYDAVRPERLPAILKDTITNPNTWRSINGAWVKG